MCLKGVHITHKGSYKNLCKDYKYDTCNTYCETFQKFVNVYTYRQSICKSIDATHHIAVLSHVDFTPANKQLNMNRTHSSRYTEMIWCIFFLL